MNTNSVSNQNFPRIIQFGAKLLLPFIATPPEKTADVIFNIATLDKYCTGEFDHRKHGFIGPNGSSIKASNFVMKNPELGCKVWDYMILKTKR